MHKFIKKKCNVQGNAKILTTKPINIKKKNLLNDKCASDYTQDKMVDPHTNIKHYDW